MRLSSLFIMAGTFAAAAVLCVVAAYFSALVIEEASKSGVRSELDRDLLTWAAVDTDGLEVFLYGTAPTEADRFKAVSAAGRVVDAARIIDQVTVEESNDMAPPRFSVEILRNAAGVSLIGLVPAATDRAALRARINRALPNVSVSDFTETADYPEPKGWRDALDFAIGALDELPRSKISAEAGAVMITGMADDEAARRRIEADLARRAGDRLALSLKLTAPRPVISPFTLRFLKQADGARFDACSVDSEESRAKIVAAAAEAGFAGKANCLIGLGVPSAQWAEATAMGIRAVGQLGAGSVTFSDTDVSLLAEEGTDQALFDRVVGELENGLPDGFVLSAVLPKPPAETPETPPEFVATLSPEGQVQLRGRINNEIARQTTDSFARATFGTQAVQASARVDETLPAHWPARVLAGLEALSYLSNGAVTITADKVAISGDTGSKTASADIAGLLTEKLGDGQDFDINVTYLEKLDPALAIPTPEQCEARIVEVTGDRKITFEPGSATIDASANDLLDDLAELLKTCGEIPLEIGGHTDSQGREIMNQQLSQARAQSVADELRKRRVLTASYTVKGYGESQPIADNGTEEGREKNRRIEFKLIRPEPVEEAVAEDTGAEPAAQAEPAAAEPQEGTANEQN